MTALASERVCVDHGALEKISRTTLIRSTHPVCILYPRSTAEVQAVVKIANEFHIPLYPISRGKNWGYGDACAPEDGMAIVDLSQMDRIVEVNEELAYAVVEPGVSQKQLYNFLQEKKLKLWMDCTGAGREASLVGNTLDRGFGHTRYGDHFATTCGMEIVLPDSTVVRTGFCHYKKAHAARLYRYGVGPALDGLFCQANLGIVTQIGLWLMPAPEAFCCFAIAVDQYEGLSPLVDRLRPLRMSGILNSALHIANDLRVLSSRFHYPWEETGGITPLPESIRRKMRKAAGIGAWTTAGAFTGSRAHVRASCHALKKALRGIGRLRFIDDRLLNLGKRVVTFLNWFGVGATLRGQLESLEPVYQLLKGIPNDEALHGAQWRLRRPPPHPPRDPLDYGCGLLWISPVIPMTGSHALAVSRLVEPIFAEYRFEPLITFTMINERSMIGILNVAFDRTDTEECERAVACYHKLMKTLMDEGYPPYRVSLEGMADIYQGSESYWEVAQRIKRALDPNEILAPGRYIPRFNK